LALRRFRITALRCIAEAELALDARRNYIYGPNGAGKTSILEGIFLLGRGRSFRTRHVRRLVRHGASGLAVYGEVDDGKRVHRIGVAFTSGRLEKKVDGQEGASGVALAEILPVHTIEPGSHDLIQGGPSERRRFLDWGVFHVEHDYLDAWRRYRRILGQRNAALKASNAATSEIGAWSAALLQAGEEIDGRRKAYVAQLADAFAERGQLLLDSPLRLDYHQGWRGDRTFAEALAESEGRDRAAGTTEIGPHRADLAIEIHGRKVQDEASRGQQKLTAVALVLAQADVLSEARAGGVLLVDDPAAELDAGALERLLAVLETVEAQLILTGLSPQQLAPRAASAVFHVERGHVRGL